MKEPPADAAATRTLRGEAPTAAAAAPVDALGPAASAGKPTGRWSQDRRLEFIDFRLRWDGRLNRADLTGFFGISVPQASLDIARYIELAPDNLTYDRTSRVYLTTQTFKPLYTTSGADRYLSELLALAASANAAQGSFLAWAPPVATVPSPGRTFRIDVLVTLLMAIREGKAVRVRYQSMTRPQATERTLAPHALAHDGFRWHVRAYCHTRSAFRDFVIGRMLEAGDLEDTPADPADDHEWHTIVPLVLAPHPGLSAAHKKVVELDYGMHDGQVEFQCRQAFLFYALRHLRLDLDDSGKPEAQQITLKNRSSIEPFLSNRSSASEP